MEFKISKNKTFGVETYYSSWIEIFGLDINARLHGCDHAGPSFMIYLFGCSLSIYIYDRRHWDYETNKWLEYDTP